MAIGAPVVVALTALLASADAVFASLLHLPDVGDLALRACVLTFGALAAAAVLRHASARTAALPLGPGARPRPPRGPHGARRPLRGVHRLRGAQVAVAGGAAERILSEEGLTYAEYARRGFFQLLAAAGLTAVVLLCVRACGRAGVRAEG